MLDDDAVTPLVALIDGDDPQLAALAAEGVAGLPLSDAARDRLRRSLADLLDRLGRDDPGRQRAVAAAGAIGTAELCGRLAAMAGDRDDPLQLAALVALVDAGDPAAAERLLERVETGADPDAAELLARVATSLPGGRLAGLQPADADTRLWVAVARARCGEAAPLLEALERIDGDGVPRLFSGDPWTAYARLAAARPLPPDVVDGLRHLEAGDLAPEAHLAVWALTGDRDAEGTHMEDLAAPPAGARPPDAAEVARLVEDPFDEAGHVTVGADVDLGGLPVGDAAAVAGAVLDRLPAGTAAEGVGNEVVSLIARMPAGLDLPVGRIVEAGFGGGPLSRQQACWILSRGELSRVVPQVAGLAATDPWLAAEVTAGIARFHGVGVPPIEGAGPAAPHEAMREEPAQPVAAPSEPDGVRAPEQPTEASPRAPGGRSPGVVRRALRRLRRAGGTRSPAEPPDREGGTGATPSASPPPAVPQPAAPEPERLAGSQPPAEAAPPPARTGADRDAAAPPPDTPERTAWPRLDCPDTVVLGVAFDLVVGLRPDLDPAVTTTGGMALPAADVAVDVDVMYDGFALLDGQRSFRLHATAGDPHPTRSLRLAAVADRALADTRTIGAVFTVEGAVRGMGSRTVRVVASAGDEVPAPPSPAAAAMHLRLPEGDGDADLTVFITRGSDAAGKHLIWGVRSTVVDVPAPPEGDEAARGDVGDRPADFLAQIIDKGSRERDPHALYTWLVGRGRRMARAMPPFVRDAIAAVVDARGDEPASILLLSQESHIPWELAVLDLPGDGQGSPFLGARAAVGRWVLATPPPEPDPPRRSEVGRTVAVTGVYDGVPGWKRLPHAEQEAADVLARTGAGVQLEPDFDAIIACLSGDPPGDLLHFALHGRFEAGGLRSGLVLLAPHPTAEGEVVEQFLEADQVLSGNLDRHPFVFLNACQVGAGDEVLGDYAGMAAAFVTIGAAAVVAPLWSIDDVAAHRFALDFYDTTLAGEHLAPAEVLRRHRAAITQAAARAAPDGSGLLTVLAYQLFGHPRYELRSHRDPAGDGGAPDGRDGTPQGDGTSQGECDG